MTRKPAGILCVVLAFVLVVGVHVVAAEPGNGETGGGLGDVAGGLAGDVNGTKLTVSSVAYVRTEPDLATINAAFSASAETAAEAEAKVRDALQAIGERMAERGHAVTVGFFSIYPRYDYSEGPGPVIVGYEARRHLEVTISDIDRVGEALELLFDLGVNEINGINYGLANEEPARKEAIRRALEQARQQAEAVAQLKGRQVVAVSSIAIDSTAEAYYSAPLPFEASADVMPSPATVRVTATVGYVLGEAQ